MRSAPIGKTLPGKFLFMFYISSMRLLNNPTMDGRDNYLEEDLCLRRQSMLLRMRWE